MSLKEQDKLISRDGDYNFDVSRAPHPQLTVQVAGELGGATAQVFSVMAGGEAAVPDGGPFNDKNIDAFGIPQRAVTFPGRFDVVRVRIVGATAATNLTIGVR